MQRWSWSVKPTVERDFCWTSWPILRHGACCIRPHSALHKPAWGSDLLFADSAQHAAARNYVATPTFAKDEIAARSRSTTNIWNMAGRINWWSICSSPYVLYGYRLCTAESDSGRKARGPVVMPSAELDAHLHNKAAEIAESRHSKQRYSPLLIL